MKENIQKEWGNYESLNVCEIGIPEGELKKKQKKYLK